MASSSNPKKRTKSVAIKNAGSDEPNERTILKGGSVETRKA